MPESKSASYQIFYGKGKGGIRLAGPKQLTEQIENAHQQASDWINANPGYQILSISNGSHENSGSLAI
ncbi:MAG: hypothetical protein ABJO14_15685 [Haloferula sp.]|uniref:hypothetical protein n=1 Tax=Haloferula sp. TaxID=2497595 RepID=UPI00329EEA51